jgi:ATP-binding cassette subfamily F protein 3
VEIEHGSRAAVVGDNGQGKTTFLRTVVDSLKPLTGDVRWGYGCQIGVYAQHVYTSLPDKQTVLEYLQKQAAFGKKDQEILEVAGSLLFRDAHLEKPITVLSGGERARLCLAGLLLSNYNVLILDEPGNHLDVDTVDALADTLLDYQGTVIFTSHDRHFTKRVATCIVEVRDSRVTHYNGQYDAYVYKVNKEIEAGERELASARTKLPPSVAKPAPRPSQKNERALSKEIKTLEKTIAQLDEQKRALNDQLQISTDADEALRLHNEVAALTEKLTEAEECWCRLQEEIDAV